MGKRWVAAGCAYLLSLCLFGGTADGAEHLRVGYVSDTGFVEEDWPGHLSGYGYEYMEFLANYGDWEFEYVPSETWVGCGEKLQSGEIDLLPEMPGSSLPFSNVALTDHVVGRLPMQLVTGAEGAKPHMRLGVLSHGYPTPSLPAIAKEEGFSYETVPYPLFYDMEAALRGGDIDGYVSMMLNPRDSQSVLAVFDRQNYRLMVRSDRRDLLERLNSAMDKMLLIQQDLRTRLNNKYLRQNGLPLVLSREEKEYLQQKKKLRTVIILRQKPYAYLEQERLEGVIPTLIRQVEADLGIPIEIVDTKTPIEAKQLLQEDAVDLSADMVCDFGWAALHNLRPTQSYMNMDFVMVKRKGANVDIGNAKVACCKDMYSTKNFIEKRFLGSQIVYVDSIEDCFRAVSGGGADILFAPRNAVHFLMEETDSYHLEAVSESSFSESISFGVCQNADPHLWQILNKEISHLDPDLLRNAFVNTNRSIYQLNPQWMIYHYPAQTAGALLALACAILAIAWWRARTKQRHLEVVQFMAYTDQRYHLPNLAWLEKQLPKLLNENKKDYRAGHLYAIVFSTEDKAGIIEMYGRSLLDRNLVDMAHRLQQVEWVLLTATGIDAGHLICIGSGQNDEDILRRVSETVEKYGYIEMKDTKVWLHMRAGICALHPEDQASIQQIIDRAHTASHEEAYGTGADVQIFNQTMQDQLLLQQRIENHMERSLAEGEFKAWYQPKYDIETRRIVGAEALVRWESKEIGFMPPGKFIPIFEMNGFVISVDYSILEQACALQRRILDEGKETVPISVNQSRLHITEEGYLEKMQAIVNKYHLPPGTIELELTETVFGDFDQQERKDQAIRVMHELHKMGFTLSVDDFGSGFSSFTMLSYLPMDAMKIDRSLLVASDDSERMEQILGNVIRLGNTLNMRVICEGIETEAQERLLLRLGCKYGQGFLNAKPMPEKDFVAFVEKRNGATA